MKRARWKLPKNKTAKALLLITFMIIWVVAVTISSQLLVGYLLLFLVGKENFALPIWSAVYSALSYIVALVVIIFVPWKAFKKFGVTRESLGLKDLPSWTDIGLAVVGFFAALVLSTVITTFFTGFSWFNANETQNIGFSLMLGGADRVIAFITLVVIAPIAEEIIFRGWLYGKLREETSIFTTNILSIIISSVLTSLLFGLVHFQWNVAVDVFCLSIVLCTLREITGTIYAGIITHMIKNGVAFYLLYVIGMV